MNKQKEVDSPKEPKSTSVLHEAIEEATVEYKIKTKNKPETSKPIILYHL